MSRVWEHCWTWPGGPTFSYPVGRMFDNVYTANFRMFNWEHSWSRIIKGAGCPWLQNRSGRGRNTQIQVCRDQCASRPWSNPGSGLRGVCPHFLWPRACLAWQHSLYLEPSSLNSWCCRAGSSMPNSDFNDRLWLPLMC